MQNLIPVDNTLLPSLTILVVSCGLTVLGVFKEFQARVEREINRKLKAVWTDNGGEYRGQFEEYCQMQGIWLEYIVLKTPKLNGMAKRMNRTIMERV